MTDPASSPSPRPERPTVAYGAWPSPFTPHRLVAGAAAVGEVRVDGDDVWWSEQRPAEGGRTQLVRRTPDGSTHDLFPALAGDRIDDIDADDRAWNARTAVLEYGGGAWTVRSGVVVFAEWSDQRLHRVEPDGEPIPITPEPAVPRGLRWSEPTWLDDAWLVCVRESHEPAAVAARGEAVHELVAVPADGSAATDPGRIRVLISGPDFVHSPAVGPGHLAWLQWHHPDMPWDATELVVGRLVRDAHGAPLELAGPLTVAGGPGESVVQPGFTGGGDLVFCSDRSGWWNPWRVRAEALSGVAAAPIEAEPVVAGGGVAAEIGGPLWVGGLRWWAEVEPGRLVVSATADGADALALVEPDGTFRRLRLAVTEVSQVVAGPCAGSALVVAASPTTEPLPYRLDLSDGAGPADPAEGNGGGAVAVPQAELTALRAPRDLGIDPSWIAVPRHVTFPSAGGRTAHALFYPPTNPEVTGPRGELPPLVVTIHGGPTSAARHRLDLAKQFWTSRGLAVVDVNHGGSTGYGRPYRDLLRSGWGVVDVEDAVAAACHLGDAGLVDPDRLAIRGGSAGGFTTLAALCFHDTFAAGTSLYGVADLAVLAQDTHKFESRYLDGLVGPWPEAAATYAERSPIDHTDGFDRPLLVLHGREDAVVPPAQAEVVVAALADRGVPHAYLLFDGEQHGFRRAETLVRALEAELWFYGRVFGFTPSDAVEPVPGAVGL